jgi:hypothetical protein
MDYVPNQPPENWSTVIPLLNSYPPWCTDATVLLQSLLMSPSVRNHIRERVAEAQRANLQAVTLTSPLMAPIILVTYPTDRVFCMALTQKLEYQMAGVDQATVVY